MTSSQAVFLNQDRTKAVKEGDKDAKFLLVREGGEISDEQAAKYEGAAALIGKGGSKKAEPEKADEIRAAPAEIKKTPPHEKGHVKHRDPKSR